MSNFTPFFLRDERIKQNAIEFIRTLPTNEDAPFVIEIKPIPRTLEQNAKLHAMCGDVSKQLVFADKKRDLQTWKMLFVSGHSIATGKPQELAQGLEGEFVNLRESTAQMSVKRMASLIEYTTAWGVSHGVHFNDRWNFWGVK